MKLFHVSPAQNNASIFDAGVDPAFSKGKRQLCWYVDETMLLWAIGHVSARHKVDANLISVWTVEVGSKMALKTRWKGVYNAKAVFVPSFVMSAVEALNQAFKGVQDMALDIGEDDATP